VAERLQALVDPAQVDVIAVQQLTPEWVEPISRAQGVIFVDAGAALPPGRVRCLALAGAPSPWTGLDPAFTHHCMPQLMLRAARALYGALSR
jgi:Ni,Fe-hydrogenase maturation factor